MSPVEALQLALSRENDALDLYRRLSQEQHNLKDLFEELAIEEEKHKKMIEDKLREFTL